MNDYFWIKYDLIAAEIKAKNNTIISFEFSEMTSIPTRQTVAPQTQYFNSKRHNFQ